MKFRLPRKLKKRLGKQHLFYPPEKDGSRVMAQPTRCQEDYCAFKKGLLTSLFPMTKKAIKKSQEEFQLLYCSPIEVHDELLRDMVTEVFAEQYRKTALSMLLRAKTNPDRVEDYHIFINAYNLGNHTTAAMCYDALQGRWKK